ncbi:MAG: exodeoxyribonuclease VII small subunit [Polyangiales bacterium]
MQTCTESTSDDLVQLPFENVMQRLESVVERLETGELSLEDSLSSFEEGIRLSRQCAARLDAAEQRIERLLDQAPPGDSAAAPTSMKGRSTHV